MSRTALEHDLVTGYLRDLVVALRGIPQARVSELVEQISSHLADALPPEASEEEIIAALQRLGPPAELAADARAAGAPARPAASRRALPRRVRRWLWIGAGLVVILTGVGWKLADPYLSAGPLQFTGEGDWWYPQDARHQVISRAGHAIQNVTPGRYGQRQGYVISLYNGYNVAQTVIADAAGPYTSWNNPGSGREQITASAPHAGMGDWGIGNGFVGQNVVGHIKFFSLPVVIPPLQSRLVRVFWITRLCDNGVDALALRVRVGWFTRTEVIPQEDWMLGGQSNINLCLGQKAPPG